MSLIVPRPPDGCSITTGPFQRSIRQVIDGVGIGGQEQRIRIHQLLEDDDVALPAPTLSMPFLIARAEAPRKLLL